MEGDSVLFYVWGEGTQVQPFEVGGCGGYVVEGSKAADVVIP